jgi:hypothetical protein
LNAVLSSVGVKSNPAAVKLILAACKGKKPQEVCLKLNKKIKITFTK